jgi:hypothetical protein
MKKEQNRKQLFRAKIALVLLALLAAACGTEAPAMSEADSQATVAALVEAKAAQTAAAAEAPVVEAPTAEAPGDTPEPTPEPAVEAPTPEALMMPGEPPDPDRTLEDVNSSHFAYEHKATAGENYLNNLFERPFTSEEMIYQPDLDITTVDQAEDDAFYYFTIRLYGMNMQGGGLKGAYSIEFDRSMTGRGDLLVQVLEPAYEWSVEGVTVYGDRNRDVGGPRPIQADTGFSGSGYDMTIDQEDDKTAFVRIDPKDGNAVQFAVSKALLEDPKEFLWGAWADSGLKDVTKFDYNDTMGPTAAGSPIKDKYYPVKDIYNLDNTCRLPVGAGQSGTVPGMCKIGYVAPPKSEGGGGGGKHCYCQDTPGVPRERCKIWVCD